MVQGVYGKKMFLVIFQDGCEHYMTLNQLTVMTVEKIPVEEETDVTRITEKPDNTFPSEHILKLPRNCRDLPMS